MTLCSGDANGGSTCESDLFPMFESGFMPPKCLSTDDVPSPAHFNETSYELNSAAGPGRELTMGATFLGLGSSLLVLAP